MLAELPKAIEKAKKAPSLWERLMAWPWYKKALVITSATLLWVTLGLMLAGVIKV